MNASYLIQKLQLQAHPEGGFYKETFRSEESIATNDDRVRNVYTSIYFLLENDEKSHFHRIKSDETWFFHQGEPMEIVVLQDGELQKLSLGNNIEMGEVPQLTILANTWFASKIKSNRGYSLVSCVVGPGFDFEDFELASKKQLMEEFPAFKSVIEEFTW